MQDNHPSKPVRWEDFKVFLDGLRPEAPWLEDGYLL